MSFTSFIETQFPVSKLSKESYKERKAGAGQTLTGLGKWWGRKPLVLVRATIIGLLLPATDDPKKDLDIFLRLMTMDEEGMKLRRNKSIASQRAYELMTEEERETYLEYDERKDKWGWKRGMNDAKFEFMGELLLRMGYDEQLSYCARPEQIDGPSDESWKIINEHCKTNAQNLQEWVQQIGEKQFGYTPKVGDAFCGGGSIPFEAARLGCEAYGSDLNPVASLLTWAGLNIIGGGEYVRKKIAKAQKEVFETVDKQIIDWGIEHNEKGWRADAYLYCLETRSPASGYMVPLAPNWIISEKYKVCGILRPDHENKRYIIDIIENADNQTFVKAKKGTLQNSRLICPETAQEFPISSIRGDNSVKGKTIYGLRMWENEDLIPHPQDTFQERLYCIRYIETYLDEKGESKTRRHFKTPDNYDIEREQKVFSLIESHFNEWQNEGFLPSSVIPEGLKTEEPKRTRGWTHWHHLFNPRQLLFLGLLSKNSLNFSDTISCVNNLISIGNMADYNCKLCRWNPGISKGPGSTEQNFYNQAFNAHYNYGTRAVLTSANTFLKNLNYSEVSKKNKVKVLDARQLDDKNDFWITDPPYADAINYHELADFFLAWYEKHLPKLFPEWYADSKAALAVKGKGQAFNKSMVEVYSNLNKNMPENGAQVVMFTHQDAKVWADLALILWASGLRVTAAWTIQTETDAGGIKKGNYVQGTVLMILRKQTSGEMGFLNDIQVDVEDGVKEQIDFMRQLDDQEDPNFGDADYQLAAYAAALRELTKYQQIGEIDVEYELGKERKKGEENEIEKIIQSAVRVAMDYLVPNGMQEQYWRKLQPEERFFLKGLEVEQGGEYRSGVYMEMARGYGLHEYSYLLNTSKANQTRLKTASEFKNKELGKGDFGVTLTRQILFAIFETIKTENPQEGRHWLYNEWKAYWDERQLILHLLDYLIMKCAHIEHWEKDVEAAKLLKGYIENDTV